MKWCYVWFVDVEVVFVMFYYGVVLMRYGSVRIVVSGFGYGVSSIVVFVII